MEPGHPTDESPGAAARVQGWLANALAAWMALLLLLYLTLGDTTPATEYLTVWPPVLWLVPAAALSVPLMRGRNRRKNAPLAAALALFALGAMEWRSLLRFGPKETPGAIRAITWNIGGGIGSFREVLAELAPHRPDIVFLQETPDGTASIQPEDLQGYWEGFHWVDAGDCGTLSRWPIRQVDAHRVGPWQPPLFAVAELPGGRTLLLANVRLMLPSLVLFPFSRDGWDRLADDNRARVAQFPALAGQVAAGSAGLDGAILGGDFNTVLSSRSVAPLRRAMADAWGRGFGWGGTATNDFPVARIDGIFASGRAAPAGARVLGSRLSDHRPVLAEVLLED